MYFLGLNSSSTWREPLPQGLQVAYANDGLILALDVQGEVICRFVDQNGKIAWKGSTRSNGEILKIDWTDVNLKSGMYVLDLTDEEGNRYWTKIIAPATHD